MHGNISSSRKWSVTPTMHIAFLPKVWYAMKENGKFIRDMPDKYYVSQLDLCYQQWDVSCMCTSISYDENDTVPLWSSSPNSKLQYTNEK